MTLHRQFKLMAHPWPLVVQKHDRQAPIPSPPEDDSLFCIVRSAESLTIVSTAQDESDALIWRALEIAGPFPFSETGIVAAVAAPLADAGISIFVINSYETDFVLIQDQDMQRAADVLATANHVLVPV